MSANEVGHAVKEVFRTLMTEKGTPLENVDPGTVLYDGGYGLDSMDTATLSAMLGERFEDDPYTDGTFPQTLNEIIAYYSSRAPVS